MTPSGFRHFGVPWTSESITSCATVYESRPDDALFQSALQRLDAERQDMTTTLEKAFGQLLDSLYHPELLLATTGTTSSGKSALVNLLCGAEIMPVAFDEMSAGVVSIRHGPNRTLTVHPTPGAVWEHGTWTDLSDNEICERLRQVMRAYHRRREELTEQPRADVLLACPRSELEYPTRIGNHPELLNLPKCCRFRILDLPGLKYVGDESNSHVIRESREALCFVTYNSEETDPIRQARLLEQVVDQVKELGGSPARMLFVLNRIDGLRRDDKEWPNNEHAFVRRMTRDIERILKERLPEYAADLGHLRIVRLSTEPALHSLHLENESHPDYLRARKKLDGPYTYLIPSDIKEDLPRRVERWSAHECQRVASSVWQTAYADTFFMELRDHIHVHFPDLVIPQITDHFKIEAGTRVAEWVVQTASAELNGSQEKYAIECGRIQAARTELQKLCEGSQRQLQEPFTRIREKLADATTATRDLFDTIRDTLDKLQDCSPFNQLPQKSLEPLCHWQEEMARKRSRTIEAIACILQGRDDAPVDVIESLPPLQLHLWHTAIHKLASAGYSPTVARSGKHIDTRDAEEKRKLHDLNRALNDLALVLSPLLQTAMERAATREQGRVFEAMRQLLEIHWKDVTERAQAKVQELGLHLNLVVPTVSLELEQQPLALAYQFAAGFDIDTDTRSENTGKTIKVQVDEKRIWYTLWIAKRPVYENRPIYEDRAYDTADVPSAEKLLGDWDRHAREQEPALVRQFIGWMFGQLNQAGESLKKSQQELLDRYQTKLDEAHAIAEHAHEETQKVWSGILEQAKELHRCLERLCCPPSRDGR